jgi:hypothetical protein
MSLECQCRRRRIRFDPDTLMVNTRDFTYAEKLGSTVTYRFAGRIGYGGAVPYGTYVIVVSVASRR